MINIKVIERIRDKIITHTKGKFGISIFIPKIPPINTNGRANRVKNPIIL